MASRGGEDLTGPDLGRVRACIAALDAVKAQFPGNLSDQQIAAHHDPQLGTDISLLRNYERHLAMEARGEIVSKKLSVGRLERLERLAAGMAAGLPTGAAGMPNGETAQVAANAQRASRVS